MPQERDDLAWALKAVPERISQYQHYDAYYDGNHQLTFATAKMNNAFGSLFRAFSLNLCAPIVDAMTDRMMIEAWGGELGEKAGQLWTQNQMDVQADQLMLEAARAGDGYLIVWPDKDGGVPRMWPQESEQMAVRYDPEVPGKVVLGAKVWRKEDPENPGKHLFRVNVYGPNEIRKWQARADTTSLPTESSKYEPYLGDGDPEGVMANPYGVVPVFHLATGASVGEYGRSVLKNIIPIQDALNKAVSDLLVAMEFVALPQRWGTGIDSEEDEETPGDMQRPAPFKAVPGSIWTIPSDEATLGQFPAGDLSQILSVADFFKISTAQVSGTPPHYLLLAGAEPPSGESLKVSEARLVKKVKKLMRAYGAVITQAMLLGLRMQGEQATGGLMPVWENPETRDERNEAETQLIKQQLGVSQRQSLSEMGYTDEEIERMKGEKDEESAAMGNAMLAAFDRQAPVSQAQGAGMAGFGDG